MVTSRKESLIQIGKFSFIGIINTLIDFATLNVLILIFGTGENGQLYTVFKAISFLAALTNSYFFNKSWVFKGGARTSKTQEGLLFFLVSGIGFILNVSISTGVFLFITRTSSINQHFSANIGAVVGSVLVLAWNYVGYKLIVFKK